MIEKAIGLVRTMRPMTWISVMLTIFTGMTVALKTFPPFIDILVISIFLPICMVGYANSLNAYTDHELDGITRPYRAIPRGIIERRTVLYFSLLLLLGSLIITFGFLSIIPSFFVIIGLVLSTAYSAQPTHIKSRGPIAPLAIAAGYVFVPFMGASFMYGIHRPDIIIIALVLTLQTIGASVSKDFIDLEGDKALNMQTLPLTRGIKPSQKIVYCGLMVPLIVFPLLSCMGYLSNGFYIYLIMVGWVWYIHRLYRDPLSYEKAYIHSFFFCTVSILLTGIIYSGVIL
ncbi:MAG: UbiA family prenyltransferase [Theionarchaea archaeon]|nr:UbiA family prenyltransferase [Theionarchaea archaeon]